MIPAQILSDAARALQNQDGFTAILNEGRKRTTFYFAVNPRGCLEYRKSGTPAWYGTDIVVRQPERIFVFTRTTYPAFERPATRIVPERSRRRQSSGPAAPGPTPQFFPEQGAFFAEPVVELREPSRRAANRQRRSSASWVPPRMDSQHWGPRQPTFSKVRDYQESLIGDEPRHSKAEKGKKASRSDSKKQAKQATCSTEPRVATEADAATHKIPSGYSRKNWDPTEEPILVLGSVFDGNSLGKWMYDWTIAVHGPNHPKADIAGDFWLLLIQLSGKAKRADEALPRVTRAADAEMLDDFIASSERLWGRKVKSSTSLQALIQECEIDMMEEMSPDGKMNQNGGRAFVNALLGRDRCLEWTESLAQKIRTWNMRFDVNCEEILRKASRR